MTPALVGSIGMGSTIAGGGISFFGNIMKGNNEASMYNYKAGIAQVNAQLAKQNADWALESGEKEALHAGLKGAQQKGRIVAAQAASGLDVNSGSNRLVQEGQEKAIQTDEAQIRTNAARRAYGYSIESWSKSNEASMYSMASDNARKAGYINALGSLVSTAGSVSDKWLQGRSQGLWNSEYYT